MPKFQGLFLKIGSLVFDEKTEQLIRTGFTLFELLVVVLIIGILAAIALPQYQKAVERSRMAEAIQVLGDYATAQSIYYMQHNEFAEDINEGDITLAIPGDAFTYEPDGSNLVATRQSGMYEGGVLAIGVEPDGTIHKGCDGPEDFCTMAESAGYELLPPGILGYGEEEALVYDEHGCLLGQEWINGGCYWPR